LAIPDQTEPTTTVMIASNHITSRLRSARLETGAYNVTVRLSPRFYKYVTTKIPSYTVNTITQ